MTHSPDYVPIPVPKDTKFPSDFFTKVSVYKEKAKGKGKASVDYSFPNKPDPHNNGIFRSGVLELSWHQEYTKCCHPLMQGNGITPFLYLSLLHAFKPWTDEDPNDFDFVIGHAKNLMQNKNEYIQNPTLFVQQLQGIGDESGDEVDEETHLGGYKACQQIHAGHGLGPQGGQLQWPN
ncbi:uncharacterized protein EI90DRAFT_3020859 [Cantharellus anzutake]|uniref:uncharacterized protein n=1 Tax=Cantharellus anzutake TaxID=1750568 RepID=UPI0019060F98|nr:uncharacterized protein EI90DRAFT_3020859 [Cantharellus anzutake]KAF8319155.1 hypothetical protein EI90DRAFT_3020859 [Cantharellus anzutake]